MNNIKKLIKWDDKKRKSKLLLFALVIFCISLTLLFGKSFAALLDNDVEVKENTELKYFLNVSYDGVDRNGVESSETTVSEIRSGTLFVEDKIPDGLEFTGFVTTDDGSIGAVKRSDGTLCVGKVVDDTNEASTTEGVWNANHTEYTYHGLHYNATNRTVTFQVKNLKAGCELTVGIKTQTPTIDDPLTPERETRRDFYNFATARERGLTINSNTVHAFMGNEFATLYNVSYEYTGTVPANAPTVPQTTSYIPGSKVGVAAPAELEGYTFSGWTTQNATVTNNSFTMPTGDVVLRGSFTQKTTNSVTYSLTGTTPTGYVLPTTKNYYPGTVVDVDTLKEGDIINGYRFLGWTSNDVTISTDRDFTMPASNVTLVGQFEEVKYKVIYQFYDGVLPPNAENYLPATQEYKPGVTVTTQNVTGEPSGYKFLGWYKEAEFEMPEQDVIIYGEWKVQAGLFEPTITKTITNPKNYYRIGDVVRFKITIANTASFPINNIIVKENTENSIFQAGTGYTVMSDHIANIDTIAANSSIDLTATYTITDTDSGTIENVAEIKGALASNGYELKEKEYKASASFKIQSQIEICKAINGTYNENIFQFHVTGTTNNYETWVNLEDDECETIFVDPSTYKIQEIIPQEYNLRSVTGAITSNGSVLTVAEGQNYTTTFTNEYTKKMYMHSFGRVENTVKEDLNGAYFLPGAEVNIKMKKLAGDNATSASNANTTITAIEHSTTEPSASNKQAANIVSTTNSPYPIYMWYENGTIKWWSEAETSYLNEDASSMFRNFSNLVNISGLEEMDSSRATTFNAIFRGNSSMTNYNPVKNWNTSNVTNMENCFSQNTILEDLKFLKNWDTSNVETMRQTFGLDLAIKKLDGLENWDTSNVKTMYGMFIGTISAGDMNLEDISALSNWDVSNVENMQGVFQRCTKLTNLDALENWDVSNVTNMWGIFQTNTSLSDITGIKNWDVSKVTNFTGMFESDTSLTNLNDLKDWDVSNVTNYTSMFSNCTGLTSASGINDWDISRTATFTKMFQYNPTVHPEFTEVEGTWDSDGTFTPGVEKVGNFLTGTEVNIKMKNLAGDDTSTNNEKTVNTNVKKILRSDTEPSASNKQTANVVSTSSSPYPIYMWFDNGTIYWWSEDKQPNMNQDSSYMFSYFNKLEDISGISKIDTSGVKKLNATFAYDPSLANLNAVSKWNTSSVTSLRQTFLGCSVFKDLTPLKNWNVSNVTDMLSLFMGASESDPMIIEDLTPIKDWNVSKVKSMQAMFAKCTYLKSLDGLENWQITSLTNLLNFQNGNTSLEDISALRNWNVSHVTNMASIFHGCTGIKSLNGLQNWDVSSATSFRYCFSTLSSLTNATAINDWNISRTANFEYMFRQTNTKPTFTKVAGTFNGQGTFIPS